jgi:RHS repeat-associated protein
LYSFGQLVPNRHASADSYRYGFNGKEKDDEVKGEGLQYDYGFRIYDPRIGKFLSQDPLFQSYPWLTPYQFAQNDPIRNIDIDGLEGGSRTQFDNVGTEWWNSTKGAISKWFSESFSSSTTPGLPDNAPNKPAVPIVKKDSKSALNKVGAKEVAENVNTSIIDYKSIGKKLNADANAVQAVALVESSGGGFYDDGAPKVRFEGHKFKKYLKEEGYDVNELSQTNSDLVYKYSERNDKYHGPKTYEKAVALDESAAMMSTSYGFGQIMGFNYKEAGFNSVQEFVTAQSTYEGQVSSFLNFVGNSPSLLKALQDKDFTEFARLYNGESYKDNNYDVQMEKKYEKLSN